MEQNVILSDIKYLDKRTQIYLKTSKIYEEWEYYQQAGILLDNAIKSYKALKALHEQDSPVPAYILTIIQNNTKIVKIYYIKFLIQAGTILPNEWKKKVDDEFQEDNEAKLACLI